MAGFLNLGNRNYENPSQIQAFGDSGDPLVSFSQF
jgi:hypothetical protein